MDHRNIILAVLGTVLVFTAPLFADSKKQDIRKLIDKRNLLALPSLASQVASNNSKLPIKKPNFKKLASEPPTLESLAGSPIKNVFWREIEGLNVVDAINSNNFSAPYCGEFFSGTDGQSSGLGGCHMAESVGYSYREIIESGTALCYMQNFAIRANLKSKGITLESGSFPEGGIEKVFSVPNGKKSRIVKAVIDNSEFIDPGSIFIEVASAAANKAEKNIYKVNIWMCKEGAQYPVNYNTITITNALNFINIHKENDPNPSNDDGGPRQTTANTSGELTIEKGKLVWNTARTRTASTTYKNLNGDFFKSQIEISKDNIIKVLRADEFSGLDFRGVVYTRYTGDSAENLRFQSGAYKERYNDFSISNAAKYNGSFYAIDAANDLLPVVLDEDLNTEFYTTGVLEEVDTSLFSCNVTPDISFRVNQANPVVKESVAECDELNQSLENTYFCQEDAEVASALDKIGMCYLL